MSKFVDLQRRFRPLSNDDLNDLGRVEQETESRYYNDYNSESWSALLNYPRTLLLGSAGTGKSHEMREQCLRINAEGGFALFLALESLASHPFDALLSVQDEQRFKEWLLSSHPGWFFLDSVDELRLTKGNFSLALLKLSKELDGTLHRTRVIISSRPTDWRAISDADVVKAHLPYLPPIQTTLESPEEAFTRALTKSQNKSHTDTENEAVSLRSTSGIRSFAILPLSETQVIKLTSWLNTPNAGEFVEEIEKKNVWTFAKRPLDLLGLAGFWKKNNRLGTKRDHHELDIKTKLDDTSRQDGDILTNEDAIAGARRLALALALTRTRTIRCPDQALELDPANSVLACQEVLPNWSDGMRQALLRRALFDPATYGRVQFHHRSIQEYLAAQQLHLLHEKGMSRATLFSLLFGDTYGVKSIIPSMRSIAAWLALWIPSVCSELIDREPEILLTAGDPELLPLHVKVELVRAFALTYGKGGWRGLRIPIEDARRIAETGLGHTIRSFWPQEECNYEVVEYFLHLIRLGPIRDCADLAKSVAIDVKNRNWMRALAIRALLSCECYGDIALISRALVKGDDGWPQEFAVEAASDLYPKHLSLSDTFEIASREPEAESVLRSYSYFLERTVEKSRETPELLEIRDRLCELIWNQRVSTQAFHRIRSKADDLVDVLAFTCSRLLHEGRTSIEPDLIRACVVAHRFGREDRSASKHSENLTKWFEENRRYRSQVFLAELALMDSMAPSNDHWERYYHVRHDSILSNLTSYDRTWLELLLKQGSPNDSAVYLFGLLDIWRRDGSSEDEAVKIRALAEHSGPLTEIVLKWTRPAKPRSNSSIIARERLRKRDERTRIKDWQLWREKLIANPDEEFSPEKASWTVRNLHLCLEGALHSTSKYSLWNRELLSRMFNDRVALLAARQFQIAWRQFSPVLWSQRAPAERNQTPYAAVYALCGLCSESKEPNWHARLSADEAKLATAIATLEINGFAVFIRELAISHASEVESVLGEEISNQIHLHPEVEHLPAIQDLSYADISIKQLLASRLMKELEGIPSNFHTHNLGHIVNILAEVAECLHRERLAQLFSSRITGPLLTDRCLQYLKGLLQIAPQDCYSLIQRTLEDISLSQEERESVGTRIFGTLFGRQSGVGLKVEDTATRARLLSGLVTFAYRYVRRDLDRHHVGGYTPDVRDEAETAREQLLSALIDTPGFAAWDALRNLALQPELSHIADRLRFLAHERAAKDSERTALSTEDLSNMEYLLEVPPSDADGLFKLMMNRLEELQHDIWHHDFSDWRTLVTIEDESEMQRTIAMRIDNKKRGAFVVTREDEVADRKKTDIRLHAIKGNQKAVIEVKIGDSRWTLAELESALRNQLLGLYLRHEQCRAGCLLITDHGKRKRWMLPNKTRYVQFRGAVEYLDGVARSIEKNLNGSVRIGVFGLHLGIGARDSR